MEQKPLDSPEFTSTNPNTELSLSTVAADHLKRTAKWARFLSILGFVFIGLMVLVAFFAGGMMALATQGMVNSSVVTIIYLMMAAFCFFPVYFLFSFSSKTLRAVDSYDATELGEALSNLRRYFQFIGILAAIYLGFMAIVILFSFLGGMMSAAF
ncbi:MAG: hypothetical protein H6585_08120 [Flavobacteriales bacterium]|nr:hypothetical protein [Flavobacteriales bacterium]MCB9448294.1 hypothetical protein [Flavobacteriales bacterium]